MNAEGICPLKYIMQRVFIFSITPIGKSWSNVTTIIVTVRTWASNYISCLT